MIRAGSGFKGLSIEASDGDIGSVKDLYFDDLMWTVRYLVVDTGAWLPGRQVVISPMSVAATVTDKVIVDLTREQVKNSPPVEADKPVNRQQEEALSRYYNYRYYWEGPYRWGLLAYPGMPPVPAPVATDPVVEEMAARERESIEGDPALRSTQDVTGYYIAALDGDIGHADDFLIDDQAWAIRYMVVDTRNWWPGKKVVLSPEWIKTVSWTDSRVYVDLRQDEIKAAPEYEPGRPFDREFEHQLFEHHGRRKYWEWEDR
ncbi:MAG: PRC-barrel domain-containing protein [Candidatus Rokuibacteriota bacterium]